MKSNIVIGFLTSENPLDKKSWSGVPYRMLNSLKHEFSKIVVLGPVSQGILLPRIIAIINYFNFLLFRKNYNGFHSILISFYYAYKFNKKIKKEQIDIIVAPAASREIALLKIKIPICYLSDTSFNQIRDYYNLYTNFSKLSVIESNFIEKRALRNSAALVYPSEWASNYVIDFYKVDPVKVHIVKFGASLDFVPDKKDIFKDFRGPINLLFLGVDWKRKGGDLVFDAFKILLKKDYEVTLTVCGCIPPVSHSKMLVIPFLDKNIEADNKLYSEIMCKSHFLFLPSRAECFGIVFCEAAAFGIPVITTDTGGIASVVEEGINGFLLPLTATSEDYARKIQSLLTTPEKLNEISQLSRTKFENELNWDIWGEKMKEILILTHNSRSF
jgi:glycosyltransferase involved in cell wall biosynthesis